MLAATATDVADAVAKTGEASVEWKLDGARVQVHRQGDEVRIYTRNLNDITERLPGVVAVARALPAEVVVLDGEVRSEEHTSELQSLMRISYAVFCLKKKTNKPQAPVMHTTSYKPSNKTHQQIYE